MLDIQSAAAEISQGKKERRKKERNHRAKILMACAIQQGGYNNGYEHIAVLT